MVKIWDICPFSSAKELGKCHNEFVAIIPDTDWVLIRDPDTMYLHPHQRAWIEDIVGNHGDSWDLLGCMTNRIGVNEQLQKQINFIHDRDKGYKIELEPDTMFDVKDIEIHATVAQCLNIYFSQFPKFFDDNKIQETDVIAGFFMLFRKSLWNKIKFEQGIDFDIKFCNAVKKAGGRIGIMKGIYIWHSYRLQHDNPTKYKKHLL